MRANVKPLVHWAIYKGYTLRFHNRSPQRVTGLLTIPVATDTPDAPAHQKNEPQPFDYDPAAMRIRLADRVTHINEYGWEIEYTGENDENSQNQDEASL